MATLLVASTRMFVSGVAVFVVATADCWASSKRAERLEQQREMFYQATLRSYSEALRPGLTRNEVESYLRAHDKTFVRMCCMETSGKNADDDLTKIGEESHPPLCSAHNVYIGFEFVSAGAHPFPEAHESDTLTKVKIFHWFEGCL